MQLCEASHRDKQRAIHTFKDTHTHSYIRGFKKETELWQNNPLKLICTSIHTTNTHTKTLITPRPHLNLASACILGDQVTSGQRRITPGITPPLPYVSSSDHLQLDFAPPLYTWMDTSIIPTFEPSWSDRSVLYASLEGMILFTPVLRGVHL